MPRPNRQSTEYWYDTFSDFSLEDQAAALKVLTQINRLAIREQQRTAKKPTVVGDSAAPEETADGRDDDGLNHPEERCPPRE